MSAARTRALALALLLAATFGALELVTRYQLFHLSADFSRFLTYDARAARLTARPAPTLRVALIGNSATERGVDVTLLRDLLHAGGRPVAIDEFFADASGVTTWYWMLEHYFFGAGRAPDLVVINFFQRFLEDGGEPLDLGRLAQFFTSTRDWPEVMRVDLRDVDARAEYLISSVWATFAARERIKERVLRLIPGYVDYASAENAINYARERARGHADGAAPALLALERLVEAARARHVRVCFVAFPTYDARRPGPYPLEPAVLRTIAEAGMDFVDLRVAEGLAPADYEDDIHLKSSGRNRYTALLAAALAPLVGKPPP
jgi:hypothetical protein